MGTRGARDAAKTPATLLGALGLCVLGAVPGHAAELQLRFLDVGQGDAVLLTHEGKHVLVDTGPSDRVVEQLRGLGVGELDLLVLTHNHADHIGGADAVLAAMPVRRYLDNELPAKSKIQSVVLSLVDRKQVAYMKPSGTITFGDLALCILEPPYEVGGDPQNNVSVGLIVEHGKFKALLTGDSEAEELNFWLEADRIPDVDVLMAAHHGSRSGMTPLQLQRAKPEVVVISVGAQNDYGHPHAFALRYYEAGGRRVLRTDLNGAVLVTVQSDGAYIVVPERASPTVTSAAPATTAVAAPPTCCVVCWNSKPCGDTCIAESRKCSKPRGCACAAPLAPRPGATCQADEKHCCRPDGTIVVPGGCQPSYPDHVAPATTRGPDGYCISVRCDQK